MKRSRSGAIFRGNDIEFSLDRLAGMIQAYDIGLMDVHGQTLV
jgi:hypothetical protein